MEHIQEYEVEHAATNYFTEQPKIISKPEPDVMILKDKHSLCEDLKYILSAPDMCDVTFLVGPDQRPVHGIKAMLASRSRIFYQMILMKEKELQRGDKTKKRSLMKKIKIIGKLLLSRPSYEHLPKPSQRKLTLTLAHHDPDVFEKMIRYIHCGIVTVDVFSVIGLLNAAERFDLESLMKACWDFSMRCIRPDLVHDLIASANRYPYSKTTNLLLQTIQNISLNTPEVLYYTPPRSNSTRDMSQSRQRSITTNGLLMRTVL